ncbi:hypothetical protein BP6252_02097 [Coleophoma cylindrospora]|uniref:AA9 family lytic polysaccharide monooxygenase n=1 Tax=Coleophoma cylindrospora TaxID=1849047 RepID=A0A3D8SDT7_9HELO|nr:hypothetical protein BP6252_02097 [Coleophoma cylindrospora]
MLFKSSAVIAASLATVVSAHQNFHQFWVDGVSPGYQVAIRMPPSNSPVTNVSSDDIACNVNGQNVPSGVSTATAAAGANFTVQWDSSSHPGPIQHFLFGPVTNASLATGVGSWVKIDEWDETNGTFASNIMEANGMTYSFNLPTNIANGDYLLRSEMLALHGSQTLGGGQFYIGCAQITITGGVDGESCSPDIQLPGSYNESDPSIYIPDFYNGFNITTYTGPGGAVATCGTGSGSSSSPATATAAATTAVATTAVSTSSAAVAAVAASSSSSVATSVTIPTTSGGVQVSTSASVVPTTLQTVAATSTSAVAASSSAAAADDTCDA